MPKTLIFDCFGVLVGGNLEYIISLAQNNEIGQKIKDLNLQADFGYISREELLEKIGLFLNKTSDEIWQIMFGNRIRMTETIAFLVKKRHEGSKIGLLSNVAKDTLETIFSKDELSFMFDEMILSSNAHLVKPDPEIYKLMAKKLNSEPENCVMIDDNRDNILGAEKIGMQGIVFETVAGLESELKKIEQS